VTTDQYVCEVDGTGTVSSLAERKGPLTSTAWAESVHDGVRLYQCDQGPRGIAILVDGEPLATQAGSGWTTYFDAWNGACVVIATRAEPSAQTVVYHIGARATTLRPLIDVPLGCYVSGPPGQTVLRFIDEAGTLSQAVQVAIGEAHVERLDFRPYLAGTTWDHFAAVALAGDRVLGVGARDGESSTSVLAISLSPDPRASGKKSRGKRTKSTPYHSLDEIAPL
jgi:hypothetical protein